MPDTTWIERRWAATSDYACQFRAVNSPVHRLGAGWKLLLGAFLCAAAIQVREPWSLAIVMAMSLGYYFAARLTLFDLWRDVRFFLIQMVIILGLYCIKFGVSGGLWPGTRTSLQIVLFFIPGIVFIRTTQSSQLMRGLRRIVPYRMAFLIFTCFRFVPIFTRELREIAMAQRLRGARITARDLLSPGNWQDLFHCLMIPLIVRAIRTADEASLSAEARGFGVRPERSYFDHRLLARSSSADGAIDEARPINRKTGSATPTQP